MATKNKWTDPTSYEFVKPSSSQELKLASIRAAARVFAETVDKALPAGPDKTHTFRVFRTAVMWASYTLSRNPDDAGEGNKNGGKEAAK